MEQNDFGGASQVQQITLHILSPSSEMPDKLTLNNCPTSITIAELKCRICNAVGTKPAPERQRLIYRGKPLLQEDATLRDVLSPEEIAASADHSLHLVLPPSVAPQTPDPSLMQPQHNAQIPPHLGLQQPSSASIPQSGQRGTPQGHLVPPHHHGGPIPPGQFPPHLQQALNNHLQVLNQQIAAQIASNAGAFAQPPRNPMQGQGPPNLHTSQPSFQQVITQQQQARAAAGQQGVSTNLPTHTSREILTPPGENATAPLPLNGRPPRASTPTNVSTVVRENEGLQGESWRMVIQSTSTVTAPNPHLPRVPTPVFQGLPSMSGGPLVNPTLQQGSNPSLGQLHIRLLEHELSSIQGALARGTLPAPYVMENARAMLRNVGATEGEPRLRSWLDQISTQADQLRTTLNSGMTRAIPELPANATATQPETLTSHPSRNSDQTSLYVLSSPTGPQALLVSNQNTYSTSWHAPTMAGTGIPLLMQPSNLQQVSNIQIPEATLQPPPPRVAANQPHPQQQRQQNQPANEARDLLRLLIPLGGHIWLLIRLFGFVYFFTAGGGSRRAILLGAFAFLIFIAQTGIFRPVVQAVWEPLRRHVEDLLPIPGNARALEPNLGINAPNPPVPETEARVARRDRQNTPNEAAARLLQERQRGDIGLMREQIRRFERAVALFVGSLIPGFGERHIAARDAAEAARQAEETRQREEAARREEVERNVQASNQGTGNESEASQAQGDVSEPPNQGQGQPQGPAAPLVEI